MIARFGGALRNDAGALNAVSDLSLSPPIVAAALALMGVLLTLTVTSARAWRDERRTREDAYRGAARSAVAELLSVAKDFQRHGSVLSDPLSWAPEGYERATQIADATEEAMRMVQHKLVVATLLMPEKELQNALERAGSAVDGAAACVHESVDSFWEGRRPRVTRQETGEAWSRFEMAFAELHGVALARLAPTIRSRRSW